MDRIIEDAPRNRTPVFLGCLSISPVATGDVRCSFCPRRRVDAGDYHLPLLFVSWALAAWYRPCLVFFAGSLPFKPRICVNHDKKAASHREVAVLSMASMALLGRPRTGQLGRMAHMNDMNAGVQALASPLGGAAVRPWFQPWPAIPPQ